MFFLTSKISRAWTIFLACLALLGATALGCFLLHFKGHFFQPKFASTSASLANRRANFTISESPEIREFLNNRKILETRMAQWRTLNAEGMPDANTKAEFQRENQALAQRQVQLLQMIIQQNAHNPFPESRPLQLPPNASQELQAFLKARDQLMRDQSKLMYQFQMMDPQIQQAVMQQWRQENANRFQQLQKMAQALIKDHQT